MRAILTLFTEDELALLADALARAASRHESQAHVTAGYFRAEHDETAAAMRRLRAKITKLAEGA